MVVFIGPCLPSPAKAPPAGPEWIHEIKHDGISLSLLTRKGNGFSSRFPQIAAAVAALPVRSCLIDGEAIVCDEAGLTVFELIRRHRHGSSAVLCAFDLLELDGLNLRWLPIEQRKRTLANAAISEPPEKLVFDRWLTGSGILVAIRSAGWRYTELFDWSRSRSS